MSLGEIGKAVVGSLPPAMLLLILLNVGCLGFVAWFLEGQLQQRDQMAKALFERCLEMTLREAP